MALSDDSSPSLPSARSAAPPLEESIEAITPARWADLSRRLTKYAYFRLRKSSWSAAEEVAQEAVLHLIDPAYAAWDRARHPDVFDCLGHLVNGIVANRRRLAHARKKHVQLRDDAEVHDDELPAPEEELKARVSSTEESEEVLPPRDEGVLLTDDRTPHSALTEERRGDLAMAALRVRLEGDALCIGVLDQMQSGVTRAAAQARALGVPVSDVYAANRRLKHHARRIAAELAQGGES